MKIPKRDPVEVQEMVEIGRRRADAWKNRLKRKIALHKAKSKVGVEQSKIAKRRLILWNKLKKHISNPDDRRMVELTLRGKNCSPRYW